MLEAQLMPQHRVGRFSQRGALTRAELPMVSKVARDHRVGRVLQPEGQAHQFGAGFKQGFGMHGVSRIREGP